MAHLVNPLLARAAGSLNLPRLTACLQSMAERRSTSDANCLTADRAADPELPWPDFCLGLANFLFVICTKLVDKRRELGPALRACAAALAVLVEALPQADATPGQGKGLRRKIEDIKRLLGEDVTREEKHAQMQEMRQQANLDRSTWQRLFGPRLGLGQLEGSGPGEYRLEGPRHSNDYADYKLISITPTQDEVECAVGPYLPRNRPGVAAHLPPGSSSGHLDTHFRLLRHDLLAPIIESLSLYQVEQRRQAQEAQQQQQGGPGGGRRSGIASGSTQLRLRAAGGGGDVRMWQYTGVRVTGISVLRSGSGSVSERGMSSLSRDGPYFTVTFDPPPDVVRLPPRQQQDFWQNTRRLEQGTLLALIDPSRCDRILFATVCERDNLKLARPAPLLCISISKSLNREADVQLLLDLMLQRGGGGSANSNRTNLVMLQSSGSFFAYEPVLKALQRAVELPFPELLTAVPKGEPGTASTRGVEVEPPEYLLQPGRTPCNLAVLATKERLAQLPDRTAAIVTRALEHANILQQFPFEQLAAATTLDPAQLQALKAGLTQKLALIQGPPGTGKTFLGILMMRVLLSSRETGAGPQRRLAGEQEPPILVVCYTNHALDQFLEGLLDAGIESIVRLGGRRVERAASKSLRLQAYNFSELRRNAPRTGRRPDENKLLAAAIPSMQALSRSILDVTEQLKRVASGKLSWADAQDFVSNTAPGIYRSIVGKVARGGDEAEGEWKMSGTVEQAWTLWASGKDEPAPLATRNAFSALACLLGDLDASGGGFLAEAGLDSLSLTLQLPVAQAAQERNWQPMDAPRGHGSQATERSLHELLRTVDAWSLNSQERRRLVGHWSAALSEDLREDLCRLMQQYTQRQRDVGSIYDSIDQALLRRAQTYELSMDSGRGFNADLSLFERLVRQNAFPVNTLLQQHRMRPEISRFVKETVYRSYDLKASAHTACAGLSWAEPKLHDHPSTLARGHVRGLMHDVYWVTHEQPEAGGGQESASKSNDWEARYAVALARYLVQQGYATVESAAERQIAILTGYVGQLQLLRRYASTQLNILVNERDAAELAEREEGEGAVLTPEMGSCIDGMQQAEVRLATVDNFQGEESDIIILSLVRSNEAGTLGFLGIENRANVMLSRAKQGMYVIGNHRHLLGARNAGIWPQVIGMFDSDGLLGPGIEVACQKHPDRRSFISHWRDFGVHAADGGCSLDCDQRLPCGHACPRKCHSDDPAHKTVACLKPCQRLHEACGHACPKRCHVPCGDCLVEVRDVKLPCGHVADTLPCYKAAKPEEVACAAQGSCLLPCGAPCQRLPCNKRCEKLLPCGCRCPSLCGEICPTEDFCIHHDSSTVQIMDLMGTDRAITDYTGKFFLSVRCLLLDEGLMSYNFAEEEVSEDPLILLPCRHGFPVSFMDGWMEMEDAYRREEQPADSEAVSNWLEPLPLSAGHKARKSCMKCRRPLPQILRYGRVLNKCQLDSAEKKHVQVSATWEAFICSLSRTQLHSEVQMQRLFTMSSINACCYVRSVQATAAQLQALHHKRITYTQNVSQHSAGHQSQLLQQGLALAAGFEQAVRNASSTPGMQVYFASRAFLLHLLDDPGSATAQADLDAVMSQLVMPRPNAAPFIEALLGRSQVLAQLGQALTTELQACIKDDIQLAAPGDGGPATTSGSAALRQALDNLQSTQDSALRGLGLALAVAQQNKAIRLQIAGLNTRAQVLVGQALSLPSMRSTVLAALLGTPYQQHIASLDREEKELLEDAEQDCRKALDALAASALDADRDSLREELHNTLASIEKAGEILKNKAASVDEMREVYEAMQRADASLRSPGLNNAGHWFTCPQGHLYVIGECGGAMQQSRCPECGATVGGSSHRLAAGNTAATSFLQMVAGRQP
ncbi:NFX1-type zinc finger-containing protein 1 [Chlorella vulgaris]